MRSYREETTEEIPAVKRMRQIAFPEVAWVLEFLGGQQEEKMDAKNEREGNVMFSFELHLGTSAQQQMRKQTTPPLCIRR